MNRPLSLRIAPERLRMSLFYRYYRTRRDKWLGLYEDAPLHYAPSVKMKLIPGDAISDPLAFTGTYEPRLTRRVAELARSGGMLIDAGANLGYFSLLWCALNPRNDCIAFEASPRTYPLLKMNIARNGFEKRVTSCPLAVGRERGTAQFNLGPAEQFGWGGLSLAQTNDTVKVDVVKIDQMVPEDRLVALLKIDIEGADTWALLGCERLLRKGLVGEVWYEQHKERMALLGIGEDTAQNYLRSVGYKAIHMGGIEWCAIPEGI
jgi:FkbM family methyltransferase